jgi:GT2 family glycosyltransferase
MAANGDGACQWHNRCHTPYTPVVVAAEISSTAHRCAIHQPEEGGSGRCLTPDQITLAITVQVPGRRDTPIVTTAEISAAAHRGAIHQPQHVASSGALTPDQITLAVAIEIAGRHHTPVVVTPEISAAAHRCAIHQPEEGGSGRRLTPDQITLAIAVQVPGRCDTPIVTAAEISAAAHRGAIHQPQHVASSGALTPDQITLAVAIEVRAYGPGRWRCDQAEPQPNWDQSKQQFLQFTSPLVRCNPPSIRAVISQQEDILIPSGVNTICMCDLMQKTTIATQKLSDTIRVKMPNVPASVIVVNWNGEQFLERCLTALMNQTVKPHEIILVDNASSDGSIDIVRRFPSLRLLAQDQNTGFARGNNLAIEASSEASQWIALINPDAFAEPDWLEALLVAATNHPAFDVFGSKLVNAADPTLLDGAGDAYHVSGLVWRKGHGELVPAIASDASDNVREVFSPCAAAAMYRRSALLELGGFDEDYFCYVEDVDLGFRLRLAGHRCLYVPQSVVHHVGSATTGGQHSDFSVYHGHRNLVWTFVKDMPSFLFWLLLPLHVLLNLATIVWFALHGQGAVIWRAKRDALLGLPKMWRKRQYVQRSRVVSAGEIWRVLDKRFFGRL